MSAFMLGANYVHCSETCNLFMDHFLNIDRDRAAPNIFIAGSRPGNVSRLESATTEGLELCCPT